MHTPKDTNTNYYLCFPANLPVRTYLYVHRSYLIKPEIPFTHRPFDDQ